MDVRLPLGEELLEATLTLPTRAPRGALVLLHGFASSRAEFADAGERLAAKGWIALAVDSRAHGARAAFDGTMSTATVVEDLGAALQFLRDEKHWSGPVGLVAHSMGAALALAALPRLRAYHAAALVAPLDTVRAEIGTAEFLGYRLANAVSRIRVAMGATPLLVPYRTKYEDLFLDPAAAARAREAGFLGEQVSLANYDALMALSGSAWARAVTTPALVVVCTHDRRVQRASSRRVYEALAGHKKLVELGSGHSAFGDRSAEDLSLLLDGWFRDVLARPG